MPMRESAFGAWLSESFVKKLKWEYLKAIGESAGVLPRLGVEERQRYETLGGRPRSKRIAFEEGAEVPFINRLKESEPQLSILIKQRIWSLQFDKQKYAKNERFEIDGIELHISEGAQRELKGATIRVVSDKIVVTYERSKPT